MLKTFQHLLKIMKQIPLLEPPMKTWISTVVWDIPIFDPFCWMLTPFVECWKSFNNCWKRFNNCWKSLNFFNNCWNNSTESITPKWDPASRSRSLKKQCWFRVPRMFLEECIGRGSGCEFVGGEGGRENERWIRQASHFKESGGPIIVFQNYFQGWVGGEKDGHFCFLCWRNISEV